jgi:hypothetical protein
VFVNVIRSAVDHRTSCASGTVGRGALTAGLSPSPPGTRGVSRQREMSVTFSFPGFPCSLGNFSFTT